MKHYLSLLLLFFITGLFGQSEYECSVEVTPHIYLCYDGNMTLTAGTSQHYNTSPNVDWDFISFTSSGAPVTVTPGMIEIVDEDAFTTAVINHIPMQSNWPPGDYLFRLCVDCEDLNGDNVHDRPCADIIVTVTPEPTHPVITELDNAQDGVIRVCQEAVFNINSLSLLPGESATVDILPSSVGLITSNIGGVVTLTAKDQGTQCSYTVVYTITNKGCIRTATVQVQFVAPFDPNRDGIIEGFIEKCPSCTKTLYLEGFRPGCGGLGTWALVPSQSDGTADIVFTSNANATATVSNIGHYVFAYTVTGIAPCPDSYFEVACDVLDIDTFTAGPDQRRFFCVDTLPAGDYPFCIPYYTNALYTWTSYAAGVEVIPDNTNCTTLHVEHNISLNPSVNVVARVSRFYIDYDCEGPEPHQLLVLPFSDPELNQEFVDSMLLIYPCNIECYDEAYISLYGVPQVEVESEDVFFLCSNGTETIKLNDYFHVLNNVPIKTVVTVLGQEPQCTVFPNVIGAGSYIQLNVQNCGGCGVFRFKVDIIVVDPNTGLSTQCTTSVYITVHVETSRAITAGTDQIKCPQEEIRLNGNSPFCSAIGTWKRIYCSSLDYYTVAIDNVRDYNTLITVTGQNDTICPPDTLCFVWSFISEHGTCDLSDTTRVIIKDSCCYKEPCAQNLHVSTECIEGHTTLTLLSNLGILDPNEYTIIWTPGGQGNPVNVLLPPNGVVYYSVEVYKIVNGDTICHTVLPGVVDCPEVGCGAHVVESCDQCGNIILTLVNASGNIIVPSTYDEIFWSVYSDSLDNSSYSVNLQNPITIQEDACYSLRYQHIIPPHILACSYTFTKTCPTITCPGPCANFNDFFVAGCGDNLDISLNLTFPSPCQSFCGSQGTSGMLGVFHKSTNLPVNQTLYNIRWGNNATTTYTTGSLNIINPVTITSKDYPCCKWKDTYTPQCCSIPTPYIECQQPITKYCRPDGSFYYIIGAPQIFWTPVPGAMGYLLEVTTGNFAECCSMGAGMTIIPSPGTSTVWSIPANYTCFSIRIRALIEGCTTPWSSPYVYCPQQVVCNPVLTVCGCCSGRSDEGNLGLPVNIVSEEEILTSLKDNPGTEYTTLQDALNAIGVNASNTVDFKVYPNPASDRILIKSGAAVKGSFKVQLTDMLQREWRNDSFDGGAENTLNVSDMPQGIYLITIRNASGDIVLSEKITVLR